MVSPNITLGKIISGLRQSARLSQEELAGRAGIHRTYVSQIERGLKSPTIVMLLKLSKALETTPSKIMRQLEAESGW
ncbi:helix-turn-helix domain-containing protein [Bradyrhizobium diazoefficiens]|uniref:helix-turn-helix domain-containing protein n=1 Tax=Bradyrhizobium diazoefficiens TaxID=1355477 RepID=UPI001FEFF974|nr:helix-turn-helix transcriptional regulator [Bradyrhizobium diazoefficiens]